MLEAKSVQQLDVKKNPRKREKSCQETRGGAKEGERETKEGQGEAKRGQSEAKERPRKTEARPRRGQGRPKSEKLNLSRVRSGPSGGERE